MNTMFRRIFLTFGAMSSLAMSAYFYNVKRVEPQLEPKERAVIQPLSARSEQKEARLLATLNKVSSVNTDLAPDPQEKAIAQVAQAPVLGEQEAELRQAIKLLEEDLTRNHTIERLNRQEVDADEREEINESFTELNELRAKLVRSKLNEIEEKLQEMEEGQEHV